MKTTVKLTTTTRITVQPCKHAGGVTIELSHGDKFTSMESMHLTADQCGALIFGMEQALEAMDVQRANYGAAA